MTAGKREVVEIRIRGVGGETAEEILRGDVVQIEGDRYAGFYEAADREALLKAESVLSDPKLPEQSGRVEAYEWGRLTSGSPATALWWVLLPFTMMNAVGWMQTSVSWLKLRRFVVALGALLLTSLFVLWLAVIAVDVVALSCGELSALANDGGCADRGVLKVLLLFDGDPFWQGAVGVSVAAAVWFLLLWMVQRSHRLEAFGPEPATPPAVTKSGADPMARLKAWSSSWWPVRERSESGGGAAESEVGFRPDVFPLTAPGFWHQWPTYRALWAWHLIFTALALGLILFVLSRRHLSGSTDVAPDGVAFGLALLAVTFWSGFWLVTKTRAQLSQSGSRWRPLLVTVLTLVALAGLGGVWVASDVQGSRQTGLVEIVRWGVVSAYLIGAVLVSMLGRWRLLRLLVAVAGPLVAAVLAAFGASVPGWAPIAVFVWLAVVVVAVPLAFLEETRSAMLAALSVIILSAGFGGVTYVVGRAIIGLEPLNSLGVEMTLPESLAISVMVVAILLWIWRRRRPTSEFDEVVEDYELGTLATRERSWANSVTSARAFARFGARGHRFLALLVVIVVGIQVVQLVIAFSLADPNLAWGKRLVYAARWDAFGPPLFGRTWMTWLHGVAATGVVLFLFPGVLLIRAMFGKRASRRQFGKVWDVLGFWPRTYHPVAAPCYAEQAVPEVRNRIATHLKQGRAVVVSAHSKGSVIAYAALCQLAGPGEFGVEPDDLKRVALVTFGSPLRALHASNFPRFFMPDQFGEVHAALADGVAPATPSLPVGAPPVERPVAWRNFYRPTDYIGRSVFADDDAATPENRDHWLFEAASVRNGSRQPLLPLESHSNYWREHELRQWTVAVAGVLSGARPAE